jgi:hypothetical protein
MKSKQALDILQVALESATEESVKSVGATVLGALVATSIANPAAAVLASVTKALMHAVFHTTSSLERKLDVLLSEPLSTASTTLTTVLSIEATTPEEYEECERLLTRAADDLAKAYTYAENSDPPQCLVIRVYQTLIAALRQGGRPFADLFSRDLLAEAETARRESSDTRDEAERIGRRDPATIEKLRDSWIEATPAFDGAHRPVSMAGFQEMLTGREAHLLTTAAKLDRKVKAWQSFCAFIDILAAHRAEVLKVPKK